MRRWQLTKEPIKGGKESYEHLGSNVAGRGNSKCKGPKVGTYQVSSGKWAAPWWLWKESEGDEVREGSRAQSSEVSQTTVRNSHLSWGPRETMEGGRN